MQAERLREKLSDARALVKKLADSLAEVDTETLIDILSDAEALIDTLAHLQAEVEAETLGDKLSVRRHWTTRMVTL